MYIFNITADNKIELKVIERFADLSFTYTFNYADIMNLLTLQRKQKEHDLRVHQDIQCLSVQNRAKHFTFHFMKYLGKLQTEISREEESKIYTDIIICCLSLANTFNTDLNKLRLLKSFDPFDKETFIKHACISIGKMAKSCESIDHLESYPYREVLTREFVEILELTIMMFNILNIDIYKMLNARWDEIEQNNIFFTDESFVFDKVDNSQLGRTQL